jgi:hypothetical protein
LFVLAIENGSELLLLDFLEGFCTTDVACISINLEERFDFGDSGDYPAHCDQLAQMNALYVSYSHGFVRFKRLEIKVATKTWMRRNQEILLGNLLSAQQMGREFCLLRAL